MIYTLVFSVCYMPYQRIFSVCYQLHDVYAYFMPAVLHDIYACLRVFHAI